MKIDPHIHSIYSGDSRSKPIDIVKRGLRIGLNAIAISDHDSVEGSKIAIEISKKMDNFLVIPSIEISSSEGHILGFGVQNLIPKGLSPEETVEKIHDEGGLAIIPHPFSFYRSGLFSNNKKNIDSLIKPLNPLDAYKNTEKKMDNDSDFNSKFIDGVEVLNARYIIGYSNFRAKKLGNKHNLAKIGSSDSHFIESIGDCYTEITDIDSEATVDDVIEAVLMKKTVAKGSRTSSFLLAKEVFNKKIRRIY